MSKNKNQYGLVRNIPAEIQKIVREKCGYGCILCGHLFCHFHHNQIEFHEAKKHDPNYIILLCPNCHAQAGQTISHKRFAEFAGNPYCKRKGFGQLPNFLAPTNDVSFKFGSTTVAGCKVILAIGGQSVIWTDPPEETDSPLRFSAIFCYDGSTFLEIRQNMLITTTTQGWNIRLQGSELRIKYAGKVVIVMDRLDNTITLRQADLRYPGGYSLSVGRNSRTLALQSPASAAPSATFDNCMLAGGRIGISL